MQEKKEMMIEKKIIRVKKREVYGRILFYPLCSDGVKIARLMRRNRNKENSHMFKHTLV